VIDQADHAAIGCGPFSKAGRDPIRLPVERRPRRIPCQSTKKLYGVRRQGHIGDTVERQDLLLYFEAHVQILHVF